MGSRYANVNNTRKVREPGNFAFDMKLWIFRNKTGFS
jgi:hypothetical protein